MRIRFFVLSVASVLFLWAGLVGCKQADVGLSAPAERPKSRETVDSYAVASTDRAKLENWQISAALNLTSQLYYGAGASWSAAVESGVVRVVSEMGNGRLSAVTTSGGLLLRTAQGAELSLPVAGLTEERAAVTLKAVRGFISCHFPDVESGGYTAAIIRGALAALDPYAAFYTGKGQDVVDGSAGKRFAGAGITILAREGGVVVSQVVEGGPAHRAGILPGDVLLAVDGVPLEGATASEAAGRIVGFEGSTVEFSVRHVGAERAVTISVVRGAIPSPPPVEVRELESGYLHARIFSFGEQTFPMLEQALRRYASHTWIKGLVLDVRDCVNGALFYSPKVAGLFLSGGTFAKTRKTPDGTPTDVAVEAASNHYSMPLVMLVNSRTGWGGEFLAGAVQDRGRGLLMGVRTLGGGSLARQFEVGNSDRMRLTSEMVFTPSLRAVDRNGIEPDCIVRTRYEMADGEVLEEPQTANVAGRPEFVVDSGVDHDAMPPLALAVLKKAQSPNVGRQLRAAADMGKEPAPAAVKAAASPAEHAPPSDTTPPVITLLEPRKTRGLKLDYAVENLSVKASVSDESGIAWAMVNGRPVTLRNGRLETSVPLKSGVNNVIINASDTRGNIARLDFSVDRLSAAPAVATGLPGVKPTLWVMAVGVSRYADSGQNLRFAADDARALSSALERLSGDLYSEVKVRVLTDQEATRENIIRAMSGFLGQAARDDVVFIFVAGHGVRYSPTGSYYFLTHDAGFDTMVSRALKWSDFQEMITILSGNTNKVILALDTCHAGAIQVGMRGGAGEDLAATMKEASGVYTLGASKPGELSVEGDAFAVDGGTGHGVFTYSLLRALGGEANYDGDDYISLTEVFGFVSREVPRLSGGAQHPYAKMTGTDVPLVPAPKR